MRTSSINYPYKYLFYVSENYSFSILRPLQDAIKNSGGEVAWFVEGEELNQEYFKTDEKRLLTVEETIEYNPRATFAPGNLIPHFLPGLKVWAFHGFVSEKRKRNNNEAYSSIIRSWFDLYCSTGPDLTKTYEKPAKELGFFKVIETGWSKVDPLFQQEKDVLNDRPIILVTSTFTPRYTLAPHLKNTIEEISKNKKWRWFVTFHPKMEKKIIHDYKSMQHENLTFIESDDVIPLLHKADVLICDSSSIKSEFLIQNKPVIAFRVEPKQAHLLHIEEASELEDQITQALSPSQEYLKQVKKYSERIHPYYDGRSSYRVLQAVEDFIESPKPVKKKPIGLIRKLKIRKKLNYWKL